MMTNLRALVAGLAVLLCAGCASYYLVTEPSGGKVFCTDDLKRNGSAVEFKDAATGSVVTLQNSAVKEVSKDECMKAAAPAPAKQ
jgi:hypothetical protein